MIEFKVSFKEDNCEFPVQLGDLQIVEVVDKDIETYDGSYTVCPTCTGCVLETENKMMREDLKIRAIPYYEVGNTCGETVIIGDDLNYGN